MSVPTTVSSLSIAGPQTNPIAIPFKFFQNVDLVVELMSASYVITTLLNAAEEFLGSRPTEGTPEVRPPGSPWE